MVAELRYIVFAPIEVIQAVTHFYDQAANRLPDGIISDVAISKSGQVAATFTIKTVNGIIEKEVDERLLMSALILYCRRQRIFLPRAAHKSLDVYNGRLEMFIAINVAPENLERIKTMLPFSYRGGTHPIGPPVPAYAETSRGARRSR
jgi:hypothetical protein